MYGSVDGPQLGTNCPALQPPTYPSNYSALGGKTKDRVGRPDEKVQIDRAFATQHEIAWDRSSALQTAPNFPLRGLVRVGTSVKAVLNVFPAAVG